MNTDLKRRATTVVNFARSGRAMFEMYLRNRMSKRSLLDPSGPVVSLTSYGRRISLSFLAIESIGRGSQRPSQLILWLDELEQLDSPSPAFQRLIERGLQMRVTEDFGPHKKYFPYVMSLERHAQALVTADDDTIYPKYWLRDLVRASERHPDDIIAHRAHSVELADQGLAPYSHWVEAPEGSRSVRNFATGMGGVMYPAQFLSVLRNAGSGFLTTTPRADDVWLHAKAVGDGRMVHQIRRRPARNFVSIRGARMPSLMDSNLVGGQNDAQIRATYGETELAILRRADSPI
jgi:hypothetical protein